MVFLFLVSLAGQFSDFSALFLDCLQVSSTFDQTFCSSVFGFLPRLS